MLREQPLIVQEEDCTATVFWKRMVFTLWRTTPMRLDASQRFLQLVQARAQTLAPQKLAIVAMFHPDTPLPGAEVRADMERGAKLLGALTHCSANIFPGTGFRAATVRSVISGLALLSKQSYPDKVFASDEQAIPWLTAQLFPDTAATEQPTIAEVFQWVRSNVPMH